MKIRILCLLIIAAVNLFIVSCKKDAPIYPGDPDFVPYAGAGAGTSSGTGTGPGTGIVTGITGTWVVTSFYHLGLSNSTEISREAVTPASNYDFAKIVFDDALKTATVFDPPTPGGNVYEKNVTYTTAGGTITFSKNPFLSSDSERITPTKASVTGSTMTLTFVDPQGVSIGGGITLYGGSEAVLTRQ